jgi:hypothetical protein
MASSLVALGNLKVRSGSGPKVLLQLLCSLSGLPYGTSICEI